MKKKILFAQAQIIISSANSIMLSTFALPVTMIINCSKNQVHRFVMLHLCKTEIIRLIIDYELLFETFRRQSTFNSSQFFTLLFNSNKIESR